MRVEYINPFVETAYSILQEVLQGEVRRGDLYLKSTSMPVMGVAALVGLAGDVEGRVLFDMSMETALKIASRMNMEELPVFDELAKATITELANLITAQAVTKLHELGFKFDLTPPALFTGEKMEISDHEVEALIVPMITEQGKIEVNVSSTFSSGDQFNKILGFIPNPLGEPFDTPYVNAAISLIIFLFVGIVLAIIFKMLLSKNMDKLDKLSLSKADIRYLNLSVFLIFLLFGVTNALKVAGVNEELVATAMSITSITVCCIASITVWEFYKLAIYHIVNKSDKIEQSLIPLFLMIGKIVIAVLAVSSIMTALGINFAAIVASAGIVTLGISLGAQSTLNQFFCGLVLLATRPFRVGDKIKLGTDGDVLIVRKISVMDTLFKNWVNEEVYRIPNSAVMESTIVNITSDDITYKVYEYFDVAYGSDIDLARQIILNTVSAHPKVIQDGSKDGPSFRFNSMESSSVRLRVTYVVTDHEIAGTVASQKVQGRGNRDPLQCGGCT